MVHHGVHASTRTLRKRKQARGRPLCIVVLSNYSSIYTCIAYIAHEHKAKQTMQSRRRSAKQHSGASSSSTKTKQLDSDEEDEAAHTFPFPPPPGAAGAVRFSSFPRPPSILGIQTHYIQHASHYSHAHALSYCTKSVCVSVTCVCAIFRIPLYWQDVCVLLCTAVH